ELESQVLGDGSIDERWSDGVGSEAEVVVSIDGGRPGWIEEAETSDFFFFSSRRRHTRFSRDWSSDVCSSDLHVRIDEDTVSRHLYTRHLPDPDLVVRTSGEMRLSNFLLWQLAYAEIYVTATLWPDFRGLHLLEGDRKSVV